MVNSVNSLQAVYCAGPPPSLVVNATDKELSAMVSKNKAQRWLIQILDCKVNILAATRPPLFPLLTSVQLPAVQPAHNPHTGCAKQTH